MNIHASSLRGPLSAPGFSPIRQTATPATSQAPAAIADQFQLSSPIEATSAAPVNCGCDPLSIALGLLATLGGSMALEAAKEIAKRTGRALADIVCEKIDDLRKTEKKDPKPSPEAPRTSGVLSVGSAHAPRLLLTLSE